MVGYGAGCQTVIKYLYEQTFGATDASYDATDKTFGHDVSLTSLAIRPNLEKLYTYDKRGVAKAVVKQFEGAMSLEFTLSNPWWLRSLFGKSYTGNASAPYFHAFEMVDQPRSIHVEIGLKLADEDKTLGLDGVIITSASVSAAVNELVKVRLDCLYKEMRTWDNKLTAVTETFEPYVFQHGRLEIPDGTYVGIVQRFEFTINNNTVMQYGLGDRYAVRPIQKALDVTGRLTLAMSDTSFITDTSGGGLVALSNEPTDASYSLMFANTIGTDRSIEFKGREVWLEDYTPSIVKNEPIMEDISLVFGTVTAFASDHFGNTRPLPDSHI